ncbi:MAG TPA: hypothetical protein PLK31_15455, partial [Chloroflexota bacterium]|nr:hypothetical protein [Chloroflexota bacterium]
NTTPTPRPLPSSSPTPVPPQSQLNDGWDNAPVLSADGRVVAFISNGWPIPNRADVRPWQQFAAFLFDRDTQQMQLVSQTQSGGVPFDNIYQVAISGDGRVLAYYSFDSMITTDDPDPCTADDWSYPCEDLFIYDRQTGQTERIPRGRTSGLGADYTVALSADGRLVAYGKAGNLVLYDRETGTAVPLLTTSDGQPPNGETLAPVMAANGDIAFISRASNLVAGDNNETYDLFVWQNGSGHVTRLSQASDGTEANGMSGLLLFHEGFSPALDISADGRFVAFASSATNLTGEPLATCQDYFQPDPRPCFNIYLYDRQTGETRVLTNGAGDSTAPTLSGDGRYLAFTTTAPDPFDMTVRQAETAPVPWQIYLLDTQTGERTHISRGADGQPAVGINVNPQLSADGRVLAFASDATTYTPHDDVHNSDIYLYDRETGQIEPLGGSDD